MSFSHLEEHREVAAYKLQSNLKKLYILGNCGLASHNSWESQTQGMFVLPHKPFSLSIFWCSGERFRGGQETGESPP